jgi:signal transduction histidine kinase
MLRNPSEKPSRCEPDLRAAYRAELRGEVMIRTARVGALVVAIINTVFIGLDRYAFSEMAPDFLWVRVSLNGVCALVYFWMSRRYPERAQVLMLIATGMMLLTVIYGSDAPNSDYYAGMMLLFVGIPVVSTLSAMETAAMVSILFAGFLVSPVLVGPPAEWTPFVTHSLFLFSAGLTSALSAGLLDRVRFSDFVRRTELETARDHLKQLDIERSRFTANVHHELRTPLTLMLAPIEAMVGGEFGDVSDLQHGYLRTMHSNGLRLLKLINNLLDLAKIEGKQLGIVRRPSAVGRVSDELISSAQPLAERKGVTLSQRGLEALPEINLDPDAFEKVLVNLLGNALKFTDSGGSIEISGTATPEGGVHLVVSDSGIGLPEDQLERIFDRFAQVDASSTRRHEGTGIGLALVKELVDLHGGRIWAESRGVGHGTQMHVVLPLGECDSEAQEDVLQTDDGKSVALGNSIFAMQGELDVEGHNHELLRVSEMQRNVERSQFDSPETDHCAANAQLSQDAPEVLICEDNADMRRLLSFLIGQEFRVRVAPNGREGLEMVRELAPDLVLTDVMMPELSGTELCREIKADPKTQGIPVVLVTSKAEREMKIEGLELGADDYVTKPFHPRELLARVRSLVKLHRLQEQLVVQNQLLENTNVELQATLAELRETGMQLVQAERLAAVGELAAGVAHEVNNPMNFATNALRTLRGYVEDVCSVAEALAAIDWSDRDVLDARVSELEKLKERLEFDDVTDSLGELVEIVTQGLDRTQRLVGDLRDFASSGDGRRMDVDLARGLQTTALLVKHSLREAGVELQMEVPERLPSLEGDARALNQVFLNLLKNAAEALHGRGGVVRVSARSEGTSILVEIRDDGPGIAPELLPKLFEPFFSTKEAGRGTGLGLSISRRVVLDHGGAIEVSSEPGEGTTFVVTLPLQGGQHAC